MNVTQFQSDDMYDNVSVIRRSMFNFIENTTEFGNVIYSSDDDTETFMMNGSDNKNEPKEYIFDRKEVRVIFVTLYSLVFCCCFFGEFNRTICLMNFLYLRKILLAPRKYFKMFK